MNKYRILPEVNAFDDSYCHKGYYLCECEDFHEKEKFKLAGVDLFLPKKYDNNHRTSHPQIGIVRSKVGETCFEVGDRVFCEHFSFTDKEKKPIGYIVDNGKFYNKIPNLNVIAKIEEDNTLTPRDGVLICEPVFGKLADTFLETKLDDRRDIARVVKVGKGVDDVEVGDYVLLEDGADYHFEYNYKNYIRVDYFFDDVIAVVDSIEWFIDEERLHVKDHAEEHFNK